MHVWSKDSYIHLPTTYLYLDSSQIPQTPYVQKLISSPGSGTTTCPSQSPEGPITHMVIPLMCLPTHTQSTRILHSNILISWILPISLLQRSSNSVCPILNLTLFPKDLLCLLDGDRTTSIQLSELENCMSACLPHAPHKPDTRAFLFFFFPALLSCLVDSSSSLTWTKHLFLGVGVHICSSHCCRINFLSRVW